MNGQAYHKAKFLLSAAQLNQLPPDSGHEVAFVGRSNAGKSSALNCLTQQKKLARTSKTPGCTQLINIFELDATHRLIDLPGYGYAKVPLTTKKKWQQLMTDYLEQRDCLRGLILLMDIRHPLTEIDQMMIEWSVANQLPVHVLLTKADKLKQGAAVTTLRKVQQNVERLPQISLQLFSSTKKTGLTDAYTVLNHWLFSTD